MSSEEIEELIRSYEGPEPRPETKAAVMDAARGVRRHRAPAATVLPVPRAPRLRSRWRPLVTAAAVLLVAGGIAYWGLGRPGPRALGKALRSGLVVRRCGAAVNVEKDGPLLVDDLVTAPSGGLIRLADGSTVKIDRGAELLLRAPEESQRVNLVLGKGRVFLRASKAPGKFLVTGSARTWVLGTVFGVTEREGRTSVGVLEGRVALASAGRELQLRRGQSGEARAGSRPTRTAADPNETLRWAREPRAFHDRPLSEVLDWISDNSSYRFHITNVRSIERTVTVMIGDEPMPQVIDKVLDSCGLKYTVEKSDVKID
jgi:ferric-dicitrate binding protein FerR (iron transport regulator)